ncbi:hypothetical protein [Rhizomicrobium electricum]|jgi:hypothetical protein|uniref:Uncharacterized protein n=1 Tax=Rhizomicrobium electricum TaxID=480070 RepID=A0ABN1E4F4_9PROT|nr:hypothetical protein [Rhizomicrobium electricum]NIJ47628.1 hypothetical protein [Rhizomicrobium electricum]
MSLMGGLVEHPISHTVAAPKRADLGDWIVRHAWRLAIGFSVMVWLIIAAIVALA